MGGCIEACLEASSEPCICIFTLDASGRDNAGLASQLYRQLCWISKQIGSCSYRYLQLCFAIRSDLENYELDLQRKQKVVGLV